MNCEDVRELSSDYLDRRLAPPQASLFEGHLGACPACREELESLRATISLIGSLDPVETTAGFMGRLQGRIKRKAAIKHLWGWFFEPIIIKVPLEVTGLLLVSVLAFLVYNKTGESPGKSVIAPRDGRETAGHKTPHETPKGRDGKEASARTRALQAGKAESDELARPRSPESFTEAKEEPASDSPVTEKIVTADIALFRQRLEALLAQVGGKLVSQEGSPASEILLTVALPQSRQGEFLSALRETVVAESGVAPLKQTEARRAKREIRESEEQITSDKVGETKAGAAAPQALLRKDEPMVRFQLRILPKP